MIFSHPENGGLRTERRTHTGLIPGVVNASVFFAVIGLGMMVYLTPLKELLADGKLIKDRLSLFGFAAPWAFTFFAAFLTVIGVPRLLLCSIGGMVFGFAGGLMWTQLGTLLGSYVVFVLVRWRMMSYALHRFKRLRGFADEVERRGLVSVVLIRQLPVNGLCNNVLLGLTSVSHGEFLLGSLLGFLPLGVTACLLGAGLIQRDWLKGVQYIALGLACSVLIGFLFNRLSTKIPSWRNYEES